MHLWSFPGTVAVMHRLSRNTRCYGSALRPVASVPDILKRSQSNVEGGLRIQHTPLCKHARVTRNHACRSLCEGVCLVRAHVRPLLARKKGRTKLVYRKH